MNKKQQKNNGTVNVNYENVFKTVKCIYKIKKNIVLFFFLHGLFNGFTFFQQNSWHGFLSLSCQAEYTFDFAVSSEF